MEKYLTEYDFEDAAKKLGVEVEMVKAVASVESAGNGFFNSGLPKILFERHYFHRLTNGRFSREYPSISNRASGGYTRDEWSRLRQAIKLDKDAALKSASWGKFQIMGANYRACGYSNVQDYADDMMLSEKNHLNAFVNFIKSKNLHHALQRKDFKGFAYGYNGPKYYKNSYDVKIRREYTRFLRDSNSGGRSSLNESMGKFYSKNEIIAVQRKLTDMNFRLGQIDGAFGPKTEDAIKRFQSVSSMPITGQINDDLLRKLDLG